MNDKDSDAIPLCIGCLEPAEYARNYCKNCGHDTGQFTTYVPFVDIRWEANCFGVMWRKAWGRQEAPRHHRVVGALLILVFAPVMLIGVPFVLWERHKKAGND